MTNITDTEARDIDGGTLDYVFAYYHSTPALALCLDYYAVVGSRIHVGCIASDPAGQSFAAHAL